ncbi:MAG: UDP-N-acetylmuramoyl-L-alanyl-D-glutamate--2,6-diaminopimelate ligase [Candidatus Firestonebacteria bacterium]
MMLSEVINNLNYIKVRGTLNKMIRSISYDSRDVKENSLFVCIPGFKVDGHNYASNAVKKGATAIIAEKEINLDEGITIIYVKDSRDALANISNEFYNHPSSKLKLIGITGTNGKTTTSYLIRSILNKHSEKVGLIGTISYDINGESFKAKNTTPESLDLQDMLNKMVKNKTDSCVMEVSSHALALHRVSYCEFDMAVFTNVTLDHSDFHKTFDDYIKNKLKLFSNLDKIRTKKINRCAVINLDDSYSKYFLENTKANIITYGLTKDAVVRAMDINSSINGLRFIITYQDKSFPVNLKLKGRYNVYNALASASVGFALNIDNEIIKLGLEEVSNVPGRFDWTSTKTGFSIIIDYAHTPDALEKLLNSVKELTPKKIICVFGCGGDRDKSKRPIMGSIASKLANYVILTSDNPRTEEPTDIMKEIKSGIVGENFEEIKDRKEAILKAINLSQKDEVVVIAGKGHEDYQIIGSNIIHFNDKEIVTEILKSKDIWKESL